MPPTVTSPRQDESAKKRERLLAVASTCFGELGYKATTTREIARRAGVSDGLLFVHFDSKEALFEAAVESVLAQWWALSEKILGEAPDTLTALDKTLRAGFDFASNTPLYRALRREKLSKGFPGKGQLLLEANRRWQQILEDILRRGIERGELRPDLDIQTTADLLNELQISYTARIFSTDGSSPLPEPLIAGLTEFINAGLRSQQDHANQED